MAGFAATTTSGGGGTEDKLKSFLADLDLTDPHAVFGDRWEECLKAFVESLPQAAQPRMLQALAWFGTSCDKVERRILVDAPGVFYRPYLNESYVSLGGQLGKGMSRFWLRVVFHGDSWIFADHITVASDDYRWKSPTTRFVHEHDTTVWETGSFALNASVKHVVRRIIQGHDVAIRFYGSQSYDDLQVTQEMKDDLKLMFEALEAAQLR